jgi:hypothetical protein
MSAAEIVTFLSTARMPKKSTSTQQLTFSDPTLLATGFGMHAGGVSDNSLFSGIGSGSECSDLDMLRDGSELTPINHEAVSGGQLNQLGKQLMSEEVALKTSHSLVKERPVRDATSTVGSAAAEAEEEVGSRSSEADAFRHSTGDDADLFNSTGELRFSTATSHLSTSSTVGAEGNEDSALVAASASGLEL